MYRISDTFGDDKAIDEYPLRPGAMAWANAVGRQPLALDHHLGGLSRNAQPYR